MAGLSRPFVQSSRILNAVLQPLKTGASRFGLLPVRSPLLGESRLISSPRGTEMFHFPRLAPSRVTAVTDRRVAPFGHPEI